MYEGERASLEALVQTDSVCVPKPVKLRRVRARQCMDVCDGASKYQKIEELSGSPGKPSGEI